MLTPSEELNSVQELEPVPVIPKEPEIDSDGEELPPDLHLRPPFKIIKRSKFEREEDLIQIAELHTQHKTIYEIADIISAKRGRRISGITIGNDIKELEKRYKAKHVRAIGLAKGAALE